LAPEASSAGVLKKDLTDGTNENTNVLLRQYFREALTYLAIRKRRSTKVALRLNQHPRKTLGFETSASRLQQSAAATVRRQL
jgi:IS30 family transposase